MINMFVILNRWYEDLQCTEVDNIILRRLQNGETVSLANGKLIERLLTIKMIRESTSTRSRSTTIPNGGKKVTKAKFFCDLVPLAEKRLKAIR